MKKQPILNPPGFVPLCGQGLIAKEVQEGAIGTKEWLKGLKLHKYWPLVSHWSYDELLSLSRENVHELTARVGGTGLTNGASGRLLRSVKELRERTARLQALPAALQEDRLSLASAALYLNQLLRTPLPTAPADPLLATFILSYNKVIEYAYLRRISNAEVNLIRKLVMGTESNPILQRAATVWFNGTPHLFNHRRTRMITLPPVQVSTVSQSKAIQLSNDSGFEDTSCPDTYNSKRINEIWQPGKNMVMFGFKEEDQENLNADMFHNSLEEKLECEERVELMIDDLLGE